MPSATDAAAPQAVLEIEALHVAYRVRDVEREVLKSLSLTVARGQSYGLVGESGCGKSTAALGAMRYLPGNGRVVGGSIKILGRDLYRLSQDELRRLRCESVAMVYQDPGKALNPSLTVGRQIREVFEIRGMDRKSARAGSHDVLKRVRIADPGKVLDRYPHQLSGGMQQRVCIAMALVSNPALLILDEPTTGLDATVEAEVLDLIAQLRAELGTSILFISHNLAVVSKMCERVGILYGGVLAEEGPSGEVLQNPRHPYTAALLRCLPRRGQRKDRNRLRTIPGFLPGLGAVVAGCAFAERCALADEVCRNVAPPISPLGGRWTRCHHYTRLTAGDDAEAAPAPRATSAKPSELVRLSNVSKTYGSGANRHQALHAVSIDLRQGETLGIVGESGSGKSTLAKVMLGLAPHDDGGAMSLDGAVLPADLQNRTAAQVKAIQIVFQNPDSALNRVHTVSQIIGRSLSKLAGLSGAARDSRLAGLLESVRLAARYVHAFPRQLSGGLKQRVAIARAFAGDPRIVVCDEPTSALDVSVQAAILNLLSDLQVQSQATYIFISHDLGVIQYISDRIVVLYLGRILEIGTTAQVFSGPHHPYTEALLSAAPDIDGGASRRIRLTGDAPGAHDIPRGCVFQARCPRKIGAICENEDPELTTLEAGHSVRCHLGVESLGRAGAADDIVLT